MFYYLIIVKKCVLLVNITLLFDYKVIKVLPGVAEDIYFEKKYKGCFYLDLLLDFKIRPTEKILNIFFKFDTCFEA